MFDLTVLLRTLLVSSAVLSSSVCLAQPDPPARESAWRALVRGTPAVARAISAEERRLLEAITPEQADAFVRGADPATLVLADGRTVADLLELLDTFGISWWTIDGGGGRSTGGSFQLSGTIGQADSGTLAGGTFELHGGFWHGTSRPPLIFSDGFETGDTTRWLTPGALGELDPTE